MYIIYYRERKLTIFLKNKNLSFSSIPPDTRTRRQRFHTCNALGDVMFDL